MSVHSGLFLIIDILATLLWLCVHLERFSDVGAGRKLTIRSEQYIILLGIYFLYFRGNTWPPIAMWLIAAALVPKDPQTGNLVYKYYDSVHYEEPEPAPHPIWFLGKGVLGFIAANALRRFVTSGGLTALLDLSA